MKAFLKATILGGVLFLLPLAIVLILLAYALRLASKVAKPISDYLDLQQWSDFAGLELSPFYRRYCWSLLRSQPASPLVHIWEDALLVGSRGLCSAACPSIRWSEHGRRSCSAGKRTRHQAGPN